MSFFSEKIQVSFDGMLMAFSNALNLVDSRLSDHHKQVAYICYELAKSMDMDEAFIKEIVMLGLVHDMGAFREEERDRMISFEVENVMEHAVTGYLLLKNISFYKPMAEAILYHHTHYMHGRNFERVDLEIAKMAQLLFLADRISVLVITSERNVLAAVPSIMEAIREGAGELFNPAYVKQMLALKGLDYFWLNLMTDSKDKIIQNVITDSGEKLDLETFKEFTKMFVYSIDFRSRYTATHSIGVATVAKALGKYCGMNEEEAQLLEIAGCFHDIGKLMIPYEILDKPGRLTYEEYKLIRQHPYYTQYILERIEGLTYIKEISSRHHETIDGGGYPYGLTNTSLSMESKLMTVADIFTALTENRPYRDESSNEEVRRLFEKLVTSGKVDDAIAATVTLHCEALHKINRLAQKEVVNEFMAMTKEKERLIKELKTVEVVG